MKTLWSDWFCLKCRWPSRQSERNQSSGFTAAAYWDQLSIFEIPICTSLSKSDVSSAWPEIVKRNPSSQKRMNCTTQKQISANFSCYQRHVRNASRYWIMTYWHHVTTSTERPIRFWQEDSGLDSCNFFDPIPVDRKTRFQTACQDLVVVQTEAWASKTEIQDLTLVQEPSRSLIREVEALPLISVCVQKPQQISQSQHLSPIYWRLKIPDAIPFRPRRRVIFVISHRLWAFIFDSMFPAVDWGSGFISPSE
jgi:hypothetical protein